MNKKKREPIFDFLRSVAMLFLFLHHLYLALPFDKDYAMYFNPFAEIFVGIAGFMVGFVYLHKNKYGSLFFRGLKILIVYFITSITVEIVFLAYIKHDFHPKSYFNKVIDIVFKLESEFNAIGILIFYAFMFLLLPIILNIYKYKKEYIIIPSVLMFGILLFPDIQNFLRGLSNAQLISHILTLLQWQMFFIIGLVLGEKHKKGTLNMLKYKYQIFTLALIALIVQITWVHPPMLVKFPFTFEKLLNLCYTLPLFLIIFAIPYNRYFKNSKFDNIIRVLGRNSLFAFAASDVVRISMIVMYREIIIFKYNYFIPNDFVAFLIACVIAFILIFIVYIYEKIKKYLKAFKLGRVVTVSLNVIILLVVLLFTFTNSQNLKTYKSNNDIFANEIKVGFGNGWYDLERDGSYLYRWTTNESFLNFEYHDTNTKKMNLNISSFYRNNKATIYLNEKEIFNGEITTDVQKLILEVDLKEGTNSLKIVSSGYVIPKNIDPNSDDTRRFSFNISAITFDETDTNMSDVDVFKSENSSPIFGDGWYPIEIYDEINYFRWMAKESNLEFNHKKEEKAKLKIFISSFSKNKKATIYLNKNIIYDGEVSTELQSLNLEVNLQNGKNNLRIISSGTERPSDGVPSSTDNRNLSFNISSITIEK